MIRGPARLLLGIFVGIVIGGGIRVFEKYTAGKLIGLLDEELKKSCDCSLQYDSADMSVFTLRSEAKNVRVVEDGKTKLAFKKVQGDFSLRQLRQHLFSLEELRLIDGYSDGVLAESATYKFIDQLCAPAENDYPGRWKVQLHRLKVIRGRFSQKAGTAILSGGGVGLVAQRTPDDFFDLRPVVRDLRLTFPTGLVVPLGKATSDMLIHDDYILFRDLNLTLKKSVLKIKARSDSNKRYSMSGGLSFFA